MEARVVSRHGGNQFDHDLWARLECVLPNGKQLTVRSGWLYAHSSNETFARVRFNPTATRRSAPRVMTFRVFKSRVL